MRRPQYQKLCYSAGMLCKAHSASRLAAIAISIGVMLGHGTAAWADPFEGWTVEQMLAHPDFQDVSSFFIASPSLARESAEPDSDFCYQWIGVIKARDLRGLSIWYYFDSNGDHVTMGTSGAYDEGMPQWVIPAVDYLAECGLLPQGCLLAQFSWTAAAKGFDPDARLHNLP